MVAWTESLGGAGSANPVVAQRAMIIGSTLPDPGLVY